MAALWPVLSVWMMGASLAPPGIDAVTPGPAAGQTDSSRETIPHVAIQPERPQMNLSDGDTLALSLEVLGVPAGPPLAVRALTNVGRIDAPTATSVWGRYVTRFYPPAERFPQVAIIAVEARFADKRARGVVRIPLLAATEIPFRTDPQARVTLRVGERTFGPVTADDAGKVKIPIVVPPGVSIGQARAVNREGNLNETVVDLQPTAYPRALIVAPPRIEAGAISELAVYGLESTGEPTPANRVNLHASKGLVHAVEGATAGEVRFLFEAPTVADAVTLEAGKASDPAGTARLVIPVQAGPPHKLTLTPSTSWLVIGSGDSARVLLAAQDRFGNRVPCEGAGLTSAGLTVPVVVTAGGEGSAMIRAPDRYQGQDALLVKATLGPVRAAMEIQLSGGPPARITAELAAASVIADGKRGVDVRVSAVDANGAPTMISGLSWELPGGRLSNVRKPRVGAYVAEFIPRRASEPHSETVAVMASQELRAQVVVRVEPPRAQLIITARVSFFSNLGSASGPAAFLDGVRPWPGRTGPLVGLRVGYLHDDLTTTRPREPGEPVNAPSRGGARIEINQFPIMAIGRYRLGLAAADIAVGGGLGISLGRTRLTPPPPNGGPPIDGQARALAAELGAEASFPLAPGRLVVGMRYLWIEFGRTSQNDEIRGNSAGFMADLGYRLSF